MSLSKKHLGYFVVDNIEFRSKIQAAIYANKVKKPMQWVFNNDVFDKYDWTIEPEESLDELYDQRARTIREKYDYVIISYSAGSDSHNLLQSFLRQNLKVDEILVNCIDAGGRHSQTITKLDTSPINGNWKEHNLQILPRLREISDRYPNIRITVMDMTERIFDFYEDSADGSWVENKIEWINPAAMHRWDITQVLDLRKRIEQNRKVAIVLGIEKPRSGFDQGNNFYMVINDRPINHCFMEYAHLWDNVDFEFFYWHPDSVRMLCKQAHLIKKFVEKTPNLYHGWSFPLTAEKIAKVQEEVVKNIIYTTWDSSWYQATKPTGGTWGIEHDAWFFDMFKGKREFYVWKDGIDYLVKNASDNLEIKNNSPMGIRPFFQKHYIGKFNPLVISKL